MKSIPSGNRAASARVSPVYLPALVDEAGKIGVVPSALFRGLGIARGDLDVPGFMVSHLEATTVVRRVLRLLDSPGLGLEMGMRSKITDRGAMALGLLASETLGDAISLTLRFPASAGYLLAVSQDRSARRHTMNADASHDDHDLEAFLVDLLFASSIRLRRQVTDTNYTPLSVELIRPRPLRANVYEDCFRCPVLFGTTRNRLISDSKWIMFPLPLANAMSYRLSCQLLEREARDSLTGRPLSHAVERTVLRMLPRIATPADIASSLNLGERTLRRNLSEEGLSFSSLLDQCRRSRALHLMASGQWSIAELAAETGFSNACNFRRAFKRWTGLPPGKFQFASVPQRSRDTAAIA